MRWYSLVVVLWIASLCTAEDLMSCGGFIRSVAPIPYARIQVTRILKLITVAYKHYYADAISYIIRVTQIQDRMCT